MFSPENYNEGVTNASKIWDEMGRDIDCTVNDDLTTQVTTPDNFNPGLPTKVFTHGFSATVKGNLIMNFINFLGTLYTF